MTEYIHCDANDGVLEICFNRPDKKNAITDAMYDKMITALANARDDDAVRVILFTAKGDYFSAGNDLADFLAANERGDSSDMKAWAFIQLLADYPKPIVAAVTGTGVGIGATLLLHCDLAYIHQDARLITPFVNLALVPEAASSLLLVQKIGHAKAFEMFVLGEPMTAQMAAECGLVNACFDDVEKVSDTARQKACAIAQKSAKAVQFTKSLMRNSDTILQQMHAEKTHFAECLAGDEAKEIFKKFLNK